MALSAVPGVESLWSLGAPLLEGPLWHAADQALWFVCIKTPAIYRLDPATGAQQSWTAPAQVGFVVPVAGERRMIAGLQTGLHLFDPSDGSFALLADPEPGLPGNRLNDAVVDPSGRLWFGSMDDAEAAPTGHFYCLDGSELRAVGGPVPITNGPAVSPDGRLLYHVDTLAGDIFVADIAADGTLGPSRLFAHVDAADGYPDGPTVDSRGRLWVGLYNGWGARCYAPDGRIDAWVPFPVSAITKIAFGGPDLRTAYATTAAKHLDAAGRAREPLAGNLFGFRVDVAGLASLAVRLRA